MALAFISFGWRVVRCSSAILKPHRHPPSNAGRLMTLSLRVKADRLHTAISVKAPRSSLAALGICSSSRPVFFGLRPRRLAFDDGEIGRRRLFAVAHGPRLYLFRLARCPMLLRHPQTPPPPSLKRRAAYDAEFAREGLPPSHCNQRQNPTQMPRCARHLLIVKASFRRPSAAKADF